ncbi:MAG: BGTF surface domain-containing protein, partial [Halodesulfurarchaeum sp.]
IYRENDAQAVGTNTFGDRLTAVTVENNGSLANRYIESIALKSNSTTVATVTSPTPNGTWVIEPTPDQGWFGPAESRTFSLHPTLTAGAPGGETVALEIPPVSDSDSDGAYDPGETGLFFEQDDPRGGFGPGPLLRVPGDAGGPSEPEPPSPIALSIDGPDGNVTMTETGLFVSITGNVSGRAIVATLQNASDGTAVQSRPTTLNSTGSTTVVFDPRPGWYRVLVKAVKSNGSAVTDPFAVMSPEQPGFRTRPASVRRGERTAFEIELGAAPNGTLRLEGPTGHVLKTVKLVPRGDHSALELALATGGIRHPAPGIGFDIRTSERGSETGSWIEGNSTERGANVSTGWAGESNRGGSVGERAGTNDTEEMPGPTGPGRNGTVEGPLEAGTGWVGPDPLDVGEYHLTLLTNGESRASTAFEVRAEWNASFESFVVPRTVSLDSPADVMAHASRRDVVAIGDQIVVAVTTSGLGGFARNISVSRDPPAANASAVARVATAGNRVGPGPRVPGSPPAFVSLGPKPGTPSAPSNRGMPVFRINGSTPGQFYVVAEVAGEGIEPGIDLETALVLTTRSPFVSPGGENESVDAAIDVIEAEAAFDGLSPDGTLDLLPRANAPIEGTTSVAPGTRLSVHIDGANDSFAETASAIVADDGSYETTANLSEYEPGTDYTVSVTADGDRLSPTRSGQFIGGESDPAAAGSGGGGSRYEVRSEGEPTEVAGEQTPTATTVESDGPAPNPIPEFPVDALRQQWSAVPRPLRIGLSALLVMLLGGLALFSVGLGVKRLLWP